MRRDAYDQAGGLNPDYHFLLDHHLWLRIAALRPVQFLDQTLAFARRHGEAKNVALAEQFGREGNRIADWLLQDTAFKSAGEAQKRRIRAGALRFDARYLMDMGAYGRAVRGYLRALFMHSRTAMQEWQRIIFSFLGLLGLGSLAGLYYRLKYRRGLRSMPELRNVADLYPSSPAGDKL